MNMHVGPSHLSFPLKHTDVLIVFLSPALLHKCVVYCRYVKPWVLGLTGIDIILLI